jgi:hypothetical protein
MNELKKILLVTFILLFSFGQLAFAHEKGEQISPATIGQDPSPEDPGNPLGTLTKGEILRLQNSNNIHKEGSQSGGKPGGVSTEDVQILYHEHIFLDIFNTYDGYRDRGELTSGGNSSYTDDATLTYSKTRSYSNGWNVSIGFSSGPVSAGVGYDVTYDNSDTFSWAMTVPPRKVGHIGGQDWYHVQEYNVRNDYYDSSGNQLDSEYGSGWAEQWYKFHFYDWLTDCDSTTCK